MITRIIFQLTFSVPQVQSLLAENEIYNPSILSPSTAPIPPCALTTFLSRFKFHDSVITTILLHKLLALLPLPSFLD